MSPSPPRPLFWRMTPGQLGWGESAGQPVSSPPLWTGEWVCHRPLMPCWQRWLAGRSAIAGSARRVTNHHLHIRLHCGGRGHDQGTHNCCSVTVAESYMDICKQWSCAHESASRLKEKTMANACKLLISCKLSDASPTDTHKTAITWPCTAMTSRLRMSLPLPW